MNEEHAYQLAAIVAYLLLMVGIGLYAYRRTKTGRDFLLAGRDLSPRVAALSAGASDMSGWLMMGLPGALYATGLEIARIGAYRRLPEIVRLDGAGVPPVAESGFVEESA
ncbi:MAG: hypothetical protein HLX51_01935 [Micrococcaceae bacterium]|nr:hypothetical protein [Micrococcaceae bacterium]